nr:ribonuclease H-like domain-containing protein [Tanacetum cinerariifolium]
MAMLSIKVHRFEKKHGRKIKFNGRENARFDKKLVKCFNCKQMGHFSWECRAQGGQNSNNYQKYKSKEAGKDGTKSKAMVIVDGNIDWDKQTEEGHTEPRSLENFGMIAGIKIEFDADLEGEVVSANDAIPAGDFVSTSDVATAIVSPPSETEFALMGLSTKVSAGQQNIISACQPNLVSVSQPNPVSAGDGILGPRPLNIQPKSTYFHSFTHNNLQIIFSITYNSLYSLYMTGGLNGKTTVKPSAGNKDKLEDFEDFDGGEVTFGGSIGKISGKGTIKTKTLNFENVLYVKELQHFNLILVSQICDQTHRVLFTKNECLVLFKDFPLPDPSMVILSISRKHNLYSFNLNKLAPKGPLTCLIAKASQTESTLWHRRLGHVNFKNMNKLLGFEILENLEKCYGKWPEGLFGLRKLSLKEWKTWKTDKEKSPKGCLASLQVKQKDDGIFISQDKYVAEILRKFGLTDGKSASTRIDTKKPLLKDPDGEDVDVHIYCNTPKLGRSGILGPRRVTS